MFPDQSKFRLGVLQLFEQQVKLREYNKNYIQCTLRNFRVHCLDFLRTALYSL